MTFDTAGRVSVTWNRGYRNQSAWGGVACCSCWQTPGAFLYAELNGSFGSEIYWTRPSLTFWETQILSVFVQGDKCVLYFHTTYTRENGLLKLKRYTSLVSPLSSIPPSFTLPPPFVSEAAILFCSNEGTSTAAGMEERGHWEEKKTLSQQLSSQACKLILFLLPFTFFQCDFSGSGWVEFTFIVTC